MSSARCVRLVEMMGLHRLDGDGHEMAPTVAPPRDWTDLEERRRAFWGIFSIDCHASISTGWPTLIDPSDVGRLVLPTKLLKLPQLTMIRLQRTFRPARKLSMSSGKNRRRPYLKPSRESRIPHSLGPLWCATSITRSYDTFIGRN